ncbi:Cellulose binding domain-containing protein [Micromonospora matsumotoense]|uniref:Cellulose binding domain-containing protein n=1 Tax=Micromonospora matsumotoense TaxID=121616 RepID=A0A1C4Z4K5_9ACTN|nr:cellulose binding domain-containing protein [Micromonospora matsumotoense]SCF27949.1 Cellulose binding domain-containing protein [Micromonospora matsumotoense]
MRLKSSLLGVAAAAVTLAAAIDGASASTTAPAGMTPPPSTAPSPSTAPPPGTALPSSPTPSSPTPSDSTPSSPPPTGAACTVRYSVYTWDTGLTSSITITNTGVTTITSWRLAFPLPAGQRITAGWNAVYSPSSGNVTARGLDDHVIIGPGASIAIGFVAEHTGGTGSPSSFTLNGTSCSLG